MAKWCGETTETLRDHCRESDRAARVWWNDCDKPERLTSSLRPGEDMLPFADRLQAEGYEWPARLAHYLPRSAASRRWSAWIVSRRPTRLDGPADGEDMTTPSPAVALRFDFNEELIDCLKGVLKSVRQTRSGRDRPHSRMPWAGGWSKTSRCWWCSARTGRRCVRRPNKGVKLTGPVAHPQKVMEGFFEREQVWDVKRCEWR